MLRILILHGITQSNDGKSLSATQAEQSNSDTSKASDSNQSGTAFTNSPRHVICTRHVACTKHGHSGTASARRSFRPALQPDTGAFGKRFYCKCPYRRNAQFVHRRACAVSGCPDTEDQILLKLAKEDAPTENPMIDKALSAANIQKTERSVSIVTELLAHQQPVNETVIRHYLSLSAKYPELPVKDIILMELHHIPVTAETTKQFLQFHTRNTQIVSVANDFIHQLTGQIQSIPDPVLRQTLFQEMKEILLPDDAQAQADSLQTPVQEMQPVHVHAEAKVLSDTEMITKSETSDAQAKNISEAHTPPDVQDDNTISGENIIRTNARENTATVPVSPAPPKDTSSFRPGSKEVPEALLSKFLNSFLMEPEEIADTDTIKKYYEELQEQLKSLEQLAEKVAEHSEESVNTTPKQIRSNLSFMDVINHVFPYVQLPLRLREHPAHGELYVYEKKRTLKPSDTLSALLHLELDALGTTDIFITLSGTHVTTRFSMTDASSCDYIKAELPALTEALAAKGYTLQSEVLFSEPEGTEPPPSLLEQFLEEHAPGSLNRYTFDIRA